MRAVLLAAGVGKRLDSFRRPKCLLRFGGRTLLERHLATLHGLGVPDVTVVAGYRAGDVAAEIDGLDPRLRPTLIVNPDFRRGSVLSLWHARAVLDAGDDVLVMDADVLYDPGVLARLVRAEGDVFLLDRDLEAGDEPVKLCVRGGRIVEFRKRVAADLDHDFAAESVGFFRFTPGTARELARATEEYVAAGRADEPHEEAIRDVLLRAPERFSYEDVTGLPWIELDFSADVDRAQAEILPRLRDAAASNGPA
jgi:choline kinase